MRWLLLQYWYTEPPFLVGISQSSSKSGSVIYPQIRASKNPHIKKSAHSHIHKFAHQKIRTSKNSHIKNHPNSFFNSSAIFVKRSLIEVCFSVILSSSTFSSFNKSSKRLKFVSIFSLILAI